MAHRITLNGRFLEEDYTYQANASSVHLSIFANAQSRISVGKEWTGSGSGRWSSRSLRVPCSPGRAQGARESPEMLPVQGSRQACDGMQCAIIKLKTCGAWLLLQGLKGERKESQVHCQAAWGKLRSRALSAAGSQREVGRIWRTFYQNFPSCSPPSRVGEQGCGERCGGVGTGGMADGGAERALSNFSFPYPYMIR